jgi:hypothetical protein
LKDDPKESMMATRKDLMMGWKKDLCLVESLERSLEKQREDLMGTLMA